jgi:hypothetical protein
MSVKKYAVHYMLDGDCNRLAANPRRENQSTMSTGYDSKGQRY